MASERARTRSRERLERLSESAIDSESVRLEAIRELKRVVGFDRWCWPLADPETLLPLSGLAEHDYGPGVRRALELEFSGNDFAAKHVLARRATTSASLGVETGGDLARSSRWDEVLRPAGIGDVVTAACRDALGCWGWIEAYRDHSDRPFDAGDLELLAQVASSLGSALRRRHMTTNSGNASPSAPGVVVLDPALGPTSWTAAARSWIEALPSARMFASWGLLPSVIYPAATLARTGAASDAHALLRTVDGRWVMIEAAVLEGRDGDDIAITLRPALASEMFDLLCRIYALSRREREVVELVVAGLDTRALSKRLHISAYTVQDHLKSVFGKTGVSSRRELRTMLQAPGIRD